MVDLDWLVGMLKRLVREGRSPDDAARYLADGVGQANADKALLQFLKMAGQVRIIKDPPGLDGDLPRGWYVGPDYEADRFWPALRSVLLADLNALDVDSIDRASTKIVSRLPCPGDREFSGRGLVLGYVQSGKTANFTAVVSKAADAGFRLIVVLSGVTNALRLQTQRRLNRELVELNPSDWIPLTSDESDFRIGKATTAASLLTTDRWLIAVVKKNVRILRRVLRWLKAAPPEIRAACPTLVIDDEADQASVNTGSGDTDRTAVNKAILDLVHLMPRVAYVGYTATPFANVFIDPSDDDLYPRDFMVDLPRPPAYFGAERIFGRDRLSQDEKDEAVDGLDVIRIVPDADVGLVKPLGRSVDEFEPRLPVSLVDALDYFVVAAAIRASRGQADQHSTMLLHTSLFSRVHVRTKPLAEKHLADRLAAVRMKDESVMTRFEEVWKREHDAVPPEAMGEAPTSFESVEPELEGVLADIEVVVENSLSDLRLDYAASPHRVHVVIGGNVLSRGLTLEGLVVSYFVRTASTYDTLLQMGRWFGYRPRYTDLPRIWMTQELADAFRDLALVERELRLDLLRYEVEGVTPLEFAPRIRTHPTLMITSAQKMQHAIDIAISYSGRFVQTTFLHRTESEPILRNQKAARTLASGLGPADEWKWVGGRWVRHNVPVDRILEFLDDYVIHPNNVEANPALLRDYIRAQVSEGELGTWSVAFVGRESNGTEFELENALRIHLLKRARLPREDQSIAYMGVITSDSDLSCDLAEDLNSLPRKDPRVSEARNEAGPLLLIYGFDKDAVPNPKKQGRIRRIALEAVDHPIGAAFVFPESRSLTPQGYKTADLSSVPREGIEAPMEEDDEEDVA